MAKHVLERAELSTAKQISPRDFPSINLMADRERSRMEKAPRVRTRFLVGLACSLILLVAVVAAIQLMPTLVVPR